MNRVSAEYHLYLNESEWGRLLSEKSISMPDRHLNHFNRVLRKSGFSASVTDGCGSRAAVEFRDEKLYLKSEAVKTEKQPEFILLQALTKKKSLEILIQKTVEIGVSQIILFKSDHSIRDMVNTARLSEIAANALMQSKSAFLPAIRISDDNTAALCSEFSSEGLFWGDFEGTVKTEYTGEKVFINGPEGGWSVTEKEFLKNHFRAVRLSDNVLRSETAAICAAFLVNTRQLW